MCANNVVRALLSVGGQVAIGQVIAGQVLVPHVAGAVVNRQGETWESAQVDLDGRQARGRADGIVVNKFDVRKVQVPIVLSLIDDHSQYLGHSVVHPLNAPVTVGIIGDSSKLAHAQQLIYSLKKLGAELQAVVREYGARATHKGMYWFTRILAVPSAVNSAAVRGKNMSARRLKRSVNSKIKVLPRGVTGREPK